MHEAKEVLRIKLSAHEKAALPLNPGEEPFGQPAPGISAKSAPFAPVCEDANGTHLSVLSRSGADECRSVGGSNAIGCHAQGDRREDAALHSRSGPGQKLEVAGRGGHCGAAGAAAPAAERGRGRNPKCRNWDCKGLRATDKLLLGVVGLLAGDVIHDAAPSGNDTECARRHIGIRRTIAIEEQSPGSARSIALD